MPGIKLAECDILHKYMNDYVWQHQFNSLFYQDNLGELTGCQPKPQMSSFYSWLLV